MSKHITLQVTEEQERALGLLLSLIGVADAPAKTAKVEEAEEVEHCSVPRKDGKPCQGTPLKGRTTCVAHSRKAEPKTKAAPKTKAKATVETKGQALSKKSRRDFVRAFVAEFGDVVNAEGVSILHWSTKQVAEYVVTTKGVTAPSGFRIGEGYQQLFS